MSEASLNWASAAVDDGTLSIELEGELSKDWTKSFKTTVKLLGHGEWGEVSLKKQQIRVDNVSPGSEEKLRHYLESVVEQANATEQQHEREREGDTNDDADKDDAGRAEPDAQMTEQFRSFAETD